jgi:galacturonosyltransferase
VNIDEFHYIPYPNGKTTEFMFIPSHERKRHRPLSGGSNVHRNKYPDTHFHICGFCEEAYESVLQAMQDEGVIIYHGLVRDVREFIGKTHCTIHPSFYPEGLSNVLLESSACGRPIITTDKPGCREVVDDGINGFVVEQRNTQDLIDKIEAFLRLNYEEKKQMGILGRQKVEQGFDRQVVVDAYLNAIAEIGNGKV